MKTFDRTAAQGDVYLHRLDLSPERIRELLDRGLFVKSDEITDINQIIVTHSETGHHHVVDGDCAVMVRPASEDSLLLLKKEAPELFEGPLPLSITDCLLIVDKPTTLDHLRDYDTHESLGLKEETVYLTRRQREYDPFTSAFHFVMD